MFLKFTIPVAPVTKKNHSQVVRLKNGRTMVLPSKQYQKYAKESQKALPKMESLINEPITLKCEYWLEKNYKVDLCNLLAATCDILIGCVIEDDNASIVVSHDGSRVMGKDRDYPRTEVTIISIKDGNDERISEGAEDIPEEL